MKISAHRQQAAHCSGCGNPAPTYDHLPRREWRHVPLWGIPVWCGYAPRRVRCERCGVRVEGMPWNEGKRPWTRARMGFLARWARRLSWRETAEAFGGAGDMAGRDCRCASQREEWCNRRSQD